MRETDSLTNAALSAVLWSGGESGPLMRPYKSLELCERRGM